MNKNFTFYTNKVHSALNSLQKKYSYDIIIILYITLICILIWKNYEETISIAWIKDYLNYSPNYFRLQVYLISLVEGNIPWNFISYYILSIGTFLIVNIIIYLILRPRSEELLIFLIFIFLFLYTRIIGNAGLVENSIPFLLLVLLIKTKKLFYLILLILFKEVIFYLGFWYLFIYTNVSKRKLTITSAFLVFTYLFIRFLIIGDRPYPPNIPFFTPPIVLNVFVSNPELILFLFPPLIVLFFLIVKTKNDLIVVIINLIPTSLFAVIIEPQIWYPIFLIILTHRKFNNKIVENPSRDKLQKT